ncbi:MAG TPA: DUF364 domain-containing protein [Syntrophorhabdaceae bacterium]|nr:DUF364 domain-containing protein [Syntrophorhabdaceae bacterium]
MDILTELIGSLREDAPVGEVRRGLHWTAVVSKRCGLASMLGSAGGCNHEMTGGMERSFTEMTALELARDCSLSNDTALLSLGLAAVNSLIDVDMNRCGDAEGLQLAGDMGKGKNIAVIGHFPYLADVARVARNLWVIEKRPHPGDFSEEQGKDLIPQSDIVVISSTTIINRTLPGILGLCREGAVKMLLGPSTPLTESLFDLGMDILSGSVVTDKDSVLRSVSEGISFMQLKKRGGVRFVTMVKDYDDILRRLKG